MEKSPVFPIVHLGGTSRTELVNQRCDVCNALRDCLRLLAEISPHPRDYIGDGVKYNQAINQHVERVCSLQGLLQEISNETELISRQEGR